VIGRQQNAHRVVEEWLDMDGVGDRRRGEVVVEDDGEVEFTAAELAVGGVSIDEVVADVQMGMVLTHGGGDLGGQLDEGAEERPQPNGAAGGGQQRTDLRFSQGQPVHDSGDVVDEQVPGRGRVHPASATHEELRVQVSFEQRDLAGDGGLGDVERSGRGGERSAFGHHRQRLQPHQVEHDVRLSNDAQSCFALMQQSASGSRHAFALRLRPKPSSSAFWCPAAGQVGHFDRVSAHRVRVCDLGSSYSGAEG
jgi:hypothetical protein